MEKLGAGLVMLLGALAVFLTRTVASDPDFIAQFASYSPWAAEHSAAIGWTATGLVMVVAIAIPPILMMQDVKDGGERLESVGTGVAVAGDIALHTAAIYMLLFFGIPGIGYLIGMGWFAAKKAAGL